MLQHAYNLYGKLIFKGIHFPELVSTVVEHLPNHPKVVGLRAAIAVCTVRDKMIVIKFCCCAHTRLDHRAAMPRKTL